MTKPTVQQLRARAREFAREEHKQSEIRWQTEKPARLLSALAQATDLGVNASVFTRYDGIIYYSFELGGLYDAAYTDSFDELEISHMSHIESELNQIQARREREAHLARVKRDLIDRLSDDEREALGL